jgi:hypothetical protein
MSVGSEKVGGAYPVLGRSPDRAELESCEVAGLVDRSTKELRHVWRTLHHTGPPPIGRTSRILGSESVARALCRRRRLPASAATNQPFWSR